MEEGNDGGVVMWGTVVEEFRQTVGGHWLEEGTGRRWEMGCGLDLRRNEKGGKRSCRAVARGICGRCSFEDEFRSYEPSLAPFGCSHWPV